MIYVVAIGVLCVVGWFWLWHQSRFVRLAADVRPSERRASGVSVSGVRFPSSDGTLLDAWLFLPPHKNAPIVIMAPGLGGTKDGLLEPFAERFVTAGIAVLVFDYRCFGGSDGYPRHWVDPVRHAEDYDAAIGYVQTALAATKAINPHRVALWGSSFSAGTSLITAARRNDISALVLQCPFLRTPPTLQPRGIDLARFTVCALLDVLGFLPPVYIPMFGKPGEWVFAPSRENPRRDDFATAASGARFWQALPRPGLGGWQNRMLARVLTQIDAFEPMLSVDNVRCPVLFVAAAADDLVPLTLVQEAHARATAPKQLHVVECGHFDLYLGRGHAENVEAQAQFLARHLLTA